MTLPPLIDIIRGCSEQTWRLNRAVIENNRPQNKGVRNTPYDNIIFHHTSGTARLDIAIAPSYSGISVVGMIQEQNLELIQRIAQLEEQLTRQGERLEEILKLITP